ncbi:hypothetical protein [Sulfuracidifex metallicus]|uniref:hypothetical protein n=1 Tax=Sulfuracidifex metallicus TaxID=47303 RepID=UPI0022752377|nr:hypothetical protein [Sulfuracidifex metallicus]MCY0849133.1 hypothetical protein [Sulfuracidifex metallicus]
MVFPKTTFAMLISTATLSFHSIPYSSFSKITLLKFFPSMKFSLLLFGLSSSINYSHRSQKDFMV